ncbi:YqaJ viral recombinase family protein [Streptomyces sp. NPDC000405]|uniref:YqaJ viral recombinase family nuclease n=1 Tax=Streptomyces sp. NPDC000405 TaxID=3161033 RepID=UPI00398CE1B8
MTSTTITAARLLGAFDPGTPEWTAARSGLVVTATEAAVLVGLSPWRSPLSLWHDKVGTVPAEEVVPTAAMRWGTRLEPVIATAYAEAHPELLVHETGTWANTARDWQRATPDRIITPAHGGPPMLLEIKTSRYGDGWGEAGTDQIPIAYRCQVVWQLDTLGLDTAHVVVLVAGQDYREYTVIRDPAEATFLRDKAAAFLDSVRAGTPPPLDGHPATYRTVQRLPGAVEDRVANIAPDVAETYRQALMAFRRAEETKRAASVAVLSAMGTARRAEAAGRKVATRSTRDDGSTRALIPHPQLITEDLAA